MTNQLDTTTLPPPNDKRIVPIEISYGRSSAVRGPVVLLALIALTLVATVACVPVNTRLADARSTGQPEPTCRLLGPSTDPDDIARIGAMFSRPKNVAQLLQNLKLAYEKELLLQPGFYDDTNLTKFFASTTVVWGEPRPISTKDTVMRNIVINADSSVFPRVTIEMRRSCWLALRFEPPNHYRPDHVKEAAIVALKASNAPGFTLEVVRSVFGPPSRQYMDYGGGDDNAPPLPPKSKGSLIYMGRGNETRAGSATESPEVTFVVKLDPPAISDAQRHQAATLNDSDSLDEIRLYEEGR